jgi:hypothetical protein
MPLNIVPTSSFDVIRINDKKLLHILAASAGLNSGKSAYCYINGTYIGGSGRSHSIITVKPDGTLKRSQTYDVFGAGVTASNSFIADFTTDDVDGNLIIVLTWDEPQSNSTPVYQFLQTRGFQKAWQMIAAYRSAWCGIYINGRGPVTEEGSTVWNSSGSTSSLGNETRAFAQIQAAVVI